MRNLVQGIGLLMVILVGWFVFFTLVNDLHLIREIDLGYSVPILAFATFVGIMALLIRSHVWFSMLSRAGANNISWSKVNSVFASTRLTRYIPGNVATLGVRIWYGKKYGLGLQASSAVGVLDKLLPIAVTLLVSAVFFLSYLLKSGGIGLSVFVWTVVIAGAVSIVTMVYAFPRIVEWILVNKSIEGIPVSLFSKIDKYFVLLAVFFLLRGTSFALFMYAVTPISFEGALLGSALFTGAALLSILVPFSPAGLGVTEATLVAGLQIILPIETVLFLTAISRVWDMVVDVLFAGIGHLMKSIVHG